jgi:hypothetical protein
MYYYSLQIKMGFKTKKNCLIQTAEFSFSLVMFLRMRTPCIALTVRLSVLRVERASRAAVTLRIVGQNGYSFTHSETQHRMDLSLAILTAEPPPNRDE